MHLFLQNLGNFLGIAWHMITEHKLQKLVTFTAILVAKSFFYSPWQPKWLRLGALLLITTFAAVFFWIPFYNPLLL